MRRVAAIFATLLLVTPTQAFRASAHVTMRARSTVVVANTRPFVAPRTLHSAAPQKRTAGVSMVGGFGGGGFLNLGTPEVIVIGAVAWAVLGPKELFRLAKQAGEFLGQWQSLGQQARDTFTSALEQELAEDEAKKEAEAAPPPAWGETPPAEPATTMASTTAAATGSSSSSIPPLEEYAAAREVAERAADGGELSEAEADALRAGLYDTLGDPESNAANFAEQMSGARNAAVMEKYPEALSADDAVGPSMGPQDGSALDVTSSDELLLQNQIDETENELAMLQAEKRVLALKRQQLEANAERARRMAEELAAEEEGAAELAPAAEAGADAPQP